MALRVEMKAKLLISNDNSATPQDIAFNSGDKTKIDSSAFAEASSKVYKLAANTTDEQVDLDNITTVGGLMVMTDDDDVSVTLVPTGKTLGDCSALPLLAGYPLVIGSSIIGIYLSNADLTDAKTVKIGAVGN